jgi:protein-disulfide isomerase
VNSTVLNRVALVIAFVGIFVAGVLSIGEILGISVPCGATFECEKVALHPSSSWFGIRVAYIGLTFYTAMAVFTALRAQIRLPRLLTIGALIAVTIGALVHIGLAIYAYSVIGATCYWCLGSMTTMVLLFFVYAMIVQAEEAALSSRTDLITTIVASIACLGATGGVVWYQWNNAGRVEVNSEALKNLTMEELVGKTPHILGDKDAPVTIVEFGDLFCGSCRKSFPEMKTLIENSKGNLRFIFKHFPLIKTKGHELSWRAATYSEYASEKGKFWQFLDLMYSSPISETPTEDQMTGAISQLGLDVSDAERRVHDDQDPLFDRVFEDFSKANELGVMLTPTYIVLAKGVNPQAASYKTLPMVLKQKQYRDAMK